VAWSPTGINVPDYPKLAQLFWENIGDVNSGAFSPPQALDRLAAQMDDVMGRMEAVDKSNNVYHGCGPRLNQPKDPSEWLSTEHAPWKKLDNEKPKARPLPMTS
jgi:glycerol transport system substrate-binding protein